MGTHPNISRRAFLKYAGLTAAGATLAACAPAPVPPTAAPQAAASAAGARLVKAVANTKKAAKDVIMCHLSIARDSTYFKAIDRGMENGCKHYGFTFQAGGSSSVNTSECVAQMETWIGQKVDLITILAWDGDAMGPTINKAVAAGIVVLTYDTDAPWSNRQVFHSQASDADQAKAYCDQLAAEMGGKGEYAFTTGALTQANKQWQYQWSKKYMAEKYPDMKLVGMKPVEGDIMQGTDIAKQFILANPNLKGIISNAGAGLPGACQAIRDTGNVGKIAVTGLTTPVLAKPYLDDGTMKACFLWDMFEYGFQMVAIADQLIHGKDITPETKLAVSPTKSSPADIRPNLINPEALDIVLGLPLKITKENAGNYDY